jgi:hypothetical protein
MFLLLHIYAIGNIIGALERRENVYKPHDISLFSFRSINDHDGS